MQPTELEPLGTHAIDLKPRPRLTIINIIIVHIATALCYATVPPLMPEIAAELSISHTMGGIIWGAFPLGMALLSPFGGPAVDRYGQRPIMTIALLAGGLSCVARAFVPNAWWLAFAMFIFGVKSALIVPAQAKSIPSHINRNHYGIATSVIFISLSVGNALAALTARNLLAPAVGGWRPLSLWSGLFMAASGVFWWFCVTDRIPLLKQANFALVIRLGTHPQVFRLTAILGLWFCGYIVLFGFLPRALTESGMSPAKVDFVVALWLTIMGLASMVGAWLSDLIGKRRPFLIFGAIFGAISLTILVFLPAKASLWLLIGAAIGNGVVAPFVLVITMEHPDIGREKTASALGFIYMVGLAWNFFYSWISGAAVQVGGLSAGLGVIALTQFAILLPVIGLLETGPKRAVIKTTMETGLAR